VKNLDKYNLFYIYNFFSTLDMCIVCTFDVSQRVSPEHLEFNHRLFLRYGFSKSQKVSSYGNNARISHTIPWALLIVGPRLPDCIRYVQRRHDLYPHHFRTLRHKLSSVTDESLCLSVRKWWGYKSCRRWTQRMQSGSLVWDTQRDDLTHAYHVGL